MNTYLPFGLVTRFLVSEVSQSNIIAFCFMIYILVILFKDITSRNHECESLGKLDTRIKYVNAISISSTMMMNTP